jgi:integrase
MAWIEQTGTCSWRVRYPRPGGGYGSVSGFSSRKAARNYASDLESDRRHGRWLDPDAAKTTVVVWAARWVETLDVETRTEENYRAYLRNHVLPRWGTTPLGEITALAVTAWIKTLRQRYAASTVSGIVTVFSMMLDDAVDERLIPASPVHRHRRRGRRRDHAPTRNERVWAMPEHVLRIADQARALGGPSAALLVITAAWTGCRWGELAGLQRDHVDLRRRTITIDPDTGALHESKHQLWLGPPKTPASARTITLPRFLAGLLQIHLTATTGDFVFTSPLGYPLRRSDFLRRVFRPAVDGDPRKGTLPVQPGLTFHGLRHSHKTWLIADGIPEIAQAQRLGHHIPNRLVETYSHVAPEIEHRLIRRLELRWRRANHSTRPPDNRPKPPGGAHHTHPARRTTPHRNMKPRQQPVQTRPLPSATSTSGGPIPPESLHLGAPDDQQRPQSAITDRTEEAPLPGKTSRREDSIKKWS